MRIKSFLLPLLLSVTAIATHPAHAVPNAKADVALPRKSALDAELFYQIMLGEFSVRAQDPQTAFPVLLDAAQKTREPALFLRAVQVAFQARSGSMALRAAKDWSQLIPQSREANRFVLEILLSLNRVTEMQEVLEREIELAPANERGQVIWSWPPQFELVSEPAVAAAVVQKALDKWLIDPQLGATAWAVVGYMWQQAGDTNKALEAARKGLAQDDKSEYAALLALSLLNQNVAPAEALVKQYLPHANVDFRLDYARMLFKQKRALEAQHELNIIHELQPDYFHAWLLEASVAALNGAPELSRQSLERYIELTEKRRGNKQTASVQRARTQSFFFLAQLAQERKDFAAAKAWLDRIDSPEDALQVRFRRADLMAAQGQVDQAIALIQSSPERSADDARLKRLAEAQLLHQQKLFERARNRLLQLTAQFPGDLDLVYALALTYERLGDLENMEQLLRRLMAARPNDADAYNALGYSLADKNLRLPEAVQLIKKALELSPNNPLIIDSLAWAEFRRGNLEQALKLLRQAFKAKPDAEIAAHLGEVLWRSNQQSEAMQVWRDALKANPDNEVLQETIKRLHVNP